MCKYLILIFLLLPGAIYSQENKSVTSKNAIIIDCADIIFTGNYAINYERQLFSKVKLKSFLSIGFGGWYSTNNNGSIGLQNVASSYSLPVTFNTITGSGSSHFECDFGLRFLVNKHWSKFQDNGVAGPDPVLNHSDVKPVMNFGYRYHKVNRKFIFRAFVGLGGIGMGFGKTF